MYHWKSEDSLHQRIGELFIGSLLTILILVRSKLMVVDLVIPRKDGYFRIGSNKKNGFTEKERIRPGSIMRRHIYEPLSKSPFYTIFSPRGRFRLVRFFISSFDFFDCYSKIMG